MEYEMGEVVQLCGQILGIVAVVLGFASYQMKTPRGIISFQMITALVFSAHYLLIGAGTAAVLNFLASVKCLVYYFRDKRGGRGLWEPVIFSAVVVVSTILTWEAWYSALIMVGLVADTIGLALNDPQKTRGVLFVKSPLCLVYNAFVCSLGGIVYECAVLISASVALVCNRKKTAGRPEGR